MGYIPGPNEDIIFHEKRHIVDLSVLIQRYKNLKTELQGLPLQKTVPDIETLDVYNQWVIGITEDTNSRIIDLYNQVKLIKDAGLLPAKYDSQYVQLENYVNNL